MTVGALSAGETAARIRDGTLTSEAAVRASLEHIAEREPEVEAWEWLDPEAALAEARARDGEAPRGALHGVPVGVKDIIDTADMPTACGSPIHAGRRPSADAGAVAALRRAGAVILGKTVTTEFATFRPGRTRNPHDARCTPGGSSSGSAAAVAAGMVPLALGSQTVGSIIRPASFCGVVGFKASRGAMPMTGVQPLAAEFDALGGFARSVADIVLLRQALTGEAAAPARTTPPRVALVRTAEWPCAAPETQQAVDSAVSALADAGATLSEPRLPDAFARLAAAHDTLFTAGAAEALAAEWREHREMLSPDLCALLERGRAVGAAELAGARGVAEECRAWIGRLFAEVDLVLAPAAQGEAPRGLGSTGDPLFNRVWTALLGPCLSLPAGSGPHGLPVGVQLAGPRGADGRFLSDAAWAQSVLLSSHAPAKA